MKKLIIVAALFLYSCSDSDSQRIELGTGIIQEVGGCNRNAYCAVLVKQEKRKFKAFAYSPIRGDVCNMYQIKSEIAVSNVQCQEILGSYEVK